MTVVARFHFGKLIGYGSVALLIFATSCWSLAANSIDSLRTASALAGGVFIGLVGLITAIRISLWRGPAVRVEGGAVHAFGQSRPIPLSEIEDVQMSASDTNRGNWTGVILYRHGKPKVRLHSWLLGGSRRRIALRLRSAIGLPAEGLRR